MISSLYQEFMVTLIGSCVSKSMVVPLDLKDQMILTVLALYMGENEDDAKEIMLGLEQYGEMVCEHWLTYYKGVRDHNRRGVTSTHASVTDLMKRMSDERSEG